MTKDEVKINQVKHAIKAEDIPAKTLELSEIRKELATLNDQVAKLKRKKASIEKDIIDGMPQGVSLMRTDYGTVSVVTTDVASVKDWNALEEYIYKNRALHLLQRRTSDPAYRDEISVRGEVPGVETFTRITVSLTTK